MLSHRSISATVAIAAAAMSAPVAKADPVSFRTKDGVTVYGDLRPATGKPRATILLFHMAGSNSGEYDPIVPVLNKAGFATLAIDQRSGGTLWGRTNKTAWMAKSGESYAKVLPDLEAAVAFGQAKNAGPLAIWGSSYSSALVFVVAAHHPEVKALLAFSPAEYIDGYSIASEAAKLAIPVYITSAPNDAEVFSANKLAFAVTGHRAVQYVPTKGVHGSATLRADENPRGAAENWPHVTAFLDRVFPRS